MTWQPIDGESLELGYHVLPQHQGMGLATEAAQAAKELARSRGVDFVIAIVAPQNTPSVRVAEKAGLRLWKHAEYQGRDHLIYRADLATA